MSDRHEFHERMINIMTPQEIINSVERNTGIPADEFLTRSGKRELVDSRKLAAHFLRKYTELTFEKIGDELNVDHSTAIYYCRQLPNILTYDQRLQRIYNSIEGGFLVEKENQEKYKLALPFLTREIFISLMKKSIEYGNEKQTINNLNRLYLNNFIIN